MNMQPSVELASRRRVLKLLGGAPMLPLASSLSAAGLLTACGGDGGSTPSYVSASFSNMAAPSLASPAAMATTTTTSVMTLKFDDNSTRDVTLAYHPFFTTGDMVSNGAGGTVLAGGYVDINGNPIMDTSGTTARQFFSDCPDGSSLLTVGGAKVSGVKGNTVFAVVQFEYTTRNLAGTSMYGLLPSPIAVLTLDQDPSTGNLTLVKYHNVNTAAIKGLWITCGASLSPWNTHLSSEEYEPDAFVASNAQLMGFSRSLFGDESTANPYDYGHLPEVTVNPDGTGSIRKHYGTGRISKELVQIMPDQRTMIMGDDATNGGAFMFVADKAADLSAGTLYVGKITQRASANDARTGAMDIQWINLGHATSAEIKALVDGGIKPTDIMDVKTKDPSDAAYTKIPYGGKSNWVKLVPGQEKAAAFLETHRYAALAGGNLGFTKWEGTTLNARDKVAYIAMSYIYKSMTDGSGGFKVGGVNAGAVYALNLKGGQKDTAGAAINSDWVPVDMAAPAALIGSDLAAADGLGNLADANRIANPDNLKFAEDLRTLFIGEDSGMHVNNFLWAYNVDTQQLSRILSTPAGAESTGLHAVTNINGWTYVMSNFQHPGDWESPLHDVVKPVLDPLVRANYKDRYGASVGYLTGTPSGIQLKA